MVDNIKPTDKLVFELNMYQIDHNTQKIESLRHEIAEKYNVPLQNVVVNFNPITVDSNGEKITLTSEVIDNIQNPEFQVELFKEYIKQKEIENIDIEDIRTIDKQVNAFIDFDQYSKYKAYRFKYVKWKNYLSYGDENYFDFTKLHGLVLLNGQPENQCGKTTFAIDLLRFALFGKAEKSPTLDSVFNVYLPEETECFVEACLEIEGTDYVIRRTVTRPPLKKRTAKSKCKQNVEYFRIVNGNYELMENCEGETNTQTNTIIKESVGSVEDYNMVISATTYSLGNLIHLGQTERGRLFSKWLGLLSLEKKEEIAKKLWKENYANKLYSNNFSKESLKSEIDELKDKISANKESISLSEGNINGHNDKIISLNNEKNELIKQRKPIKEDILKADVSTIEASIKKNNDILANKRAEFSNLKDEYTKVKEITFDKDGYDKNNAEIELKNTKIHNIDVANAELRVKYDAFVKDNARIQKLIDGKVCPTCGQEINTTMQHDGIEKNNAEMKKLVQEGKDNNAEKQKIQGEIDKLKEEKLKMEENRDAVQKRQNLELKMSALKSNIDNIKLQIENLNEKQKEIEENKDNIRHNQEIDLLVKAKDEAIGVETRMKESLIAEKQRLVFENERCEADIKKMNTMIEELEKEEVLIRNWNLYQEMVGKNGIVKIVLKRALPVINNEIDRILNGLCDFNVILGINEKNEIIIDMVRDGKSLDLGTGASGFESTFTSLALRSALSRIGTMPKSNFMVLDEVDSTIAVSNYDNLKKLYHRILNGYDFIIHIVHNELLSDMHDMTVTVTKSGNVSKIATC